MVNAAFNVEGCADGSYRFKLVDGHKRSILLSGRHPTVEACCECIDALKLVVRQQTGIHILKTRGQNWFFVVMLNNTMLAQSPLFAELDLCEEAAAEVRTLAPRAVAALSA